MSSYCDAAHDQPWHGPFHDREHGFPPDRDEELFERLVLAIGQAGVSWPAVLERRAAYRAAFDGFDIDRVAAYRGPERARIMADPQVLANGLKLDATIHNAQVLQGLRAQWGSFRDWLDVHHPSPPEAWIRLFRRTFHFTGDEVVHEFLRSTGYLPGAHRPECPVFSRVVARRPPWLLAAEGAG